MKMGKYATAAKKIAAKSAGSDGIAPIPAKTAPIKTIVLGAFKKAPTGKGKSGMASKSGKKNKMMK
jgi:hypothetical protein